MYYILCDYCSKEAKLVEGDQIYPHRKDLHSKNFYLCNPCGAYVGCYPGTVRPLGRLANAELRKWKQLAHHAFDPLWKSRKMTRSRAYSKLAKALGVPFDQAHIGMFTIEQCKQVVEKFSVNQGF